MALIWPFGVKLTDSSGNALSGAKLRVYTAGTTTPANLFSDAGLSTGITNPVVADADGMLANGGNECAVYIAEGSYDIAILSSADAVLSSVDDYAPPSSDSADILRTLTSNARIFITGSGGEVFIRAGSPSPTNTGGDLTLEGWAGTQLDTLTLNSAETSFTGNVDIDGDLTVGGELIPAIVTSGTMASAAELVIPLTGGFQSYTIELYEIAATNAAALRITVSIDSGSTYVAGANYDSYSVAFDASAGSNPGVGWWYGTVGNLSTTAGKMQTLAFDLDTPASGTGDTTMIGQTSIADIGYRTWGAVSAGGRVTHVKIAVTAGTITCKWRLRNRG